MLELTMWMLGGTLIFMMFFFLSSVANATETVSLFFDVNVEQINFAANDVKKTLESQGFTVEMIPLSSLEPGYAKKKVVIGLLSDADVVNLLKMEGGSVPTGLGEQAYALRTTNSGQHSFWVLGGDINGAMYGGLQIAENLSLDGFRGEYNNEEAPFMPLRGMKLNLPFDKRLPTYVGGWSSNSAKQAIPHVWDMSFWKELIDHQARNRYNLLSVWAHHPFPALVKLEDYPDASLPRIEGFDGYENEMAHEQRVAFWHEVMQYAHSRGMKFYFFNWNVYVDYAEDQYPQITRDLSNSVTIDYMNQSIKALIDTYPELDGFGITAGDGMSNSPEDNTTWTYHAIGKAVKEYLSENPSREFNLVHRSVYSNPALFDRIYAPLKEVPNLTMDYSFKYARAHMYSTTTPRWSADIEKAKKLGIRSWVTLRNDDYFYINWGDPKFVRDYMAGIPEKDNVIAINIGADGYNPSRTYFLKDEAMNGQLEVKRRWYMEMLWGRISYNPQMSDDIFKNMLAKRFPTVSADSLFEAWTLASRPLPKVTELIMDNWSLDFHWYPEACWSDPGRETGFRTIDGFANDTTVAKGSELCDIATSAAGNCEGKKSSYVVADEMQADAWRALQLVSSLKSDGNQDLDMALKNIEQMANLGMYYSHKVRGATLKAAGEIEKARESMGKAYYWWISYSRAMEKTYHTDSFRNLSINPDWTFGDAPALKEYTDLGGTGLPSYDCIQIQEHRLRRVIRRAESLEERAKLAGSPLSEAIMEGYKILDSMDTFTIEEIKEYVDRMESKTSNIALDKR